MNNEEQQQDWDNYTVGLEPDGYVWFCPKCGMRNHEDTFERMVECDNCGMEYNAEPSQDHSFER